MAEQQSGLRFDIFERVHLANEVDGIESLEEIELTPHIELTARGEQTVLKGFLRLSGRYTNARDQHQTENLEHRIPVDISMPSDRIQNAEELGVEIDHFDIDLLSTRTLNVTGVLYLRGVQAAETRPSAQEQQEEEMYFVHQAMTESDQNYADNIVEMRQSESSESEEAQAPQFPESFVRDERVQSGQQSSVQKQRQEQQLTEAQTEQQAEASEAEESLASIHSKEQSEQPAEIETSEMVEEAQEADGSIEAENNIAEATVKHEAAPEMKIAFTGKNTQSNELIQAADFKTMLQNNAALKEREESGKAEQIQSDEVISAQDSVKRPDSNEAGEGSSAADKVQWKNLFLPKEEDEERQFSKVRMCIVQKEETLDTIAERYSLNPREILLYNRLGEQQEVTEGQIIYIPRTE